jgi:hypothetical protein
LTDATDAEASPGELDLSTLGGGKAVDLPKTSKRCNPSTLIRNEGRQRQLLLPEVVVATGGMPFPTPPTSLDFKLTWQSFLDSEVVAVPGLEEGDFTLLPSLPTLAPPLAPPRLDLLPRLSGLLGPMEEDKAAAAERDDAINQSSRVDKNPTSGNNRAIALEGMVDRRFFLPWTSGPSFFLVGIALVLFSPELPLFLFSSVRPRPAVAPTPPPMVAVPLV